MTREPLHGTSGRLNILWRGKPVYSLSPLSQTPRFPRDTSQRGWLHAEAGMGFFHESNGYGISYYAFSPHYVCYGETVGGRA